MRKFVFFLSCTLILTSCTTVEPVGVAPGLTEPKSKATDAPESFLPEQISESVPTAESTRTPAPATDYFFDSGVNPLTGLRVSDPERLNRRPVMVKVSNWPREGRPHAGLNSADIVFEYYIGHQMNRFTALFYGEDAEQIGPVRSGRLVDAQLGLLYQGILAYGNADPQVDAVLIEALGGRALAFNNVSCPVMCGESTYAATGVLANSAAVTEYARSVGVDQAEPDLRGMFFQAEPPRGDAQGVSLRVEYANFSIMQWYYDLQQGNYHLWMEADSDEGLTLAPMTDRNDDQPVTFDNLVIMFAEYIEYAPSLHDIRIQSVSDYQPALLFRDGLVTYGSWRVPEDERPIIFETPEGTSLPFKPGRTWIVIMGVNSITVQPGEGAWEINFALP